MDKKTTERLLKNYYNARKSWEGWCYLNNIHLKKNNSSIREYVDQNELLYHCRYLLLKDLHIELYKIIKNSKNTKDNIFKLLNSIDSKEVIQLIAELNDFKSELDSLTNTRDKFYAHLDEDYEDFLKSFEIENYYKTFEYIESGIMLLGKEKELKEILKTIPSRNEFELKV